MPQYRPTPAGTYLHALDRASIDLDIAPFAKYARGARALVHASGGKKETTHREVAESQRVHVQ
jgi:hypothetical protein